MPKAQQEEAKAAGGAAGGGGGGAKKKKAGGGSGGTGGSAKKKAKTADGQHPIDASGVLQVNCRRQRPPGPGRQRCRLR